MKRRPAHRKPTNRLGAPAGAVPDRKRSATAQDATWETITLSLPPDTTLPVPADRWRRQDGRIVATYTPDALGLAVKLALAWELADLEARMEWGLETLASATGCDDTQAERLLARWHALEATYTATVTALAAVNQSVNPAAPCSQVAETMDQDHPGNPVLDDRTARKNLS